MSFIQLDPVVSSFFSCQEHIFDSSLFPETVFVLIWGEISFQTKSVSPSYVLCEHTQVYTWNWLLCWKLLCASPRLCEAP